MNTAGNIQEEAYVGGERAYAQLVVKLGYRGADFSGFAEQDGRRTVAGELRRALETCLHREVQITCAGRTDAGVHALAQVVSVPITQEECGREGTRIHRTLSALAPDDISVQGIYRAPAGFSARFSALSRSYRYRICPGEARPVLSWGHAWWLRARLDVEAMDAAAQALLGEYDFKSFAKTASTVGKTTMRELEHVQVSEVEEAGEQLVAFDVRGNAFLHNMVRNIVGSLVEVGRGHRDPAWIAEVLRARDRRFAGPCAPANGLTFVGVDYPDGVLEPWED